MFCIIIPGEPVGKGRLRFSRKSGVGYTPPKTVNYENLVKEIFSRDYPEHVPDESEYVVSIHAYFPIPKSTSKAKRKMMEDGLIHPAKKPDIDNLCKAILDGLNKILWRDDCQVIRCFCYKEYGEKPGVIVNVKTFEEYCLKGED